jgi:hypothetical protein
VLSEEKAMMRLMASCPASSSCFILHPSSLFLRFAGFLAIVLTLGAADEEPAAESPSWLTGNMATFFQGLGVVLAILAVALIVWGGMLIHRRLAQRAAEEKQVALMFEAQMGGLAASRSPGLPRTSPPSPAAPYLASAPPGSPALAAPQPLTPGGPAPESASVVEDILAKLRAGGLFTGVEGSLFLSDGQTEGKIVRLTDGRTAFVMPRSESAEFLARQIKRFDLCIFPLVAGQICVLTPLGAFIADRIKIA